MYIPRKFHHYNIIFQQFMKYNAIVKRFRFPTSASKAAHRKAIKVCTVLGLTPIETQKIVT